MVFIRIFFQKPHWNYRSNQRMLVKQDRRINLVMMEGPLLQNHDVELLNAYTHFD